MKLGSVIVDTLWDNAKYIVIGFDRNDDVLILGNWGKQDDPSYNVGREYVLSKEFELVIE